MAEIKLGTFSSMSMSFYENVDPRRRQELTDARMIQEDHTAMANAPTRFIHEEFNPDRFGERLSMYNQSTKKYPS